VNTKLLKSLALATLVATMAAGCASYRVSGSAEAPAAALPAYSGPVLIVEGDLKDRAYTAIAPIEITVKKLTVFHKDPTKEQANEALIEKARSIGANAVINVTYTSGIGFTTWGYIDAKGIGVKLKE